MSLGHVRLFLYVSGILLFAVSCSSSQVATPATAMDPCSYQVNRPYTQLAARAQGLRVAVLGSSSTQGTGAPAGKGYVDIVRQALKQRGWNVDIRNYGIGGETTEQMAQRWASTQQVDVDLLIVQPMSNDVLAGKTPHDVHAALRLLDTVLNEKPYDVAIVGTQYLGPDEDVRFPHKRALDSLLRDWAKSRHLAYLDRSAQAKQQPDPMALLASDGIHPNEAGHALVAQCVLHALFPEGQK